MREMRHVEHYIHVARGRQIFTQFTMSKLCRGDTLIVLQGPGR